MENLDNNNEMNNVDKKFDKVEKIWDRLQKLLLKVLGGIVGISLAVYVAYGQLKEKHKEHFEEVKKEHAEQLKEHESHTENGKPTYTITKKTFIIDSYGNRKGDTVYVDYYSDGYVDKYYKSDSKTYYEDE
jgi:predicted histidine transporter YuiF (NhaC family)